MGHLIEGFMSFEVRGPKLEEACFEVSIREGPEELTLRAEEVGCINVGHIAEDNWSSEVIFLIFEEWEVGWVVLSCSFSLLDLVMPRNEGCVGRNQSRWVLLIHCGLECQEGRRRWSRRWSDAQVSSFNVRPEAADSFEQFVPPLNEGFPSFCVPLCFVNSSEGRKEGVSLLLRSF